MSRPPAGLLLATAALVALVGTGTALPTPDRDPAPAARVVPVAGATVVCPAVRSVPGALGTRVAVGSTRPDAPLGGDPGTVTARPLSGGEAVPVPLPGPGAAAVDQATGVADDALVVTAEGPVAAGLEVDALTRGLSGPDRGLSAQRCTAPGTEAWFAGGSAAPGEVPLLVLANPDRTPAVVDVTAWSEQGPVDPRPGRGRVVPPEGRLLLRLDELAPGRTGLAVHVVAGRGRFAALLRSTGTAAATPQGAEQVPASPPPAADVQLVALPPGPGARSVQVTNPGQVPAVVRLTVSTADGQFVPVGGDAVPVAPGTSVVTDLTQQAATGPVAVAVHAEGAPVLAVGTAVDGAEAGVRERAYAGAAAPLGGRALVPDLAVDPALPAALLLTAPQGDAAVRLFPLPLAGAAAGPLPAPQTVAVPGGRSVEVPLAAALGPGRYALEVRPLEGSGPVLAASTLRGPLGDGPVLVEQALTAGVRVVRQPVVARDPAAGLPPP